jgi:hypothetical protein
MAASRLHKCPYSCCEVLRMQSGHSSVSCGMWLVEGYLALVPQTNQRWLTL